MEYGLLSLLPPIVAIALAIATRRAVVPLAIGVFVGAVLLRDPDAAWWSPGLGFVLAIWNSIIDSDHLQALCFSLLVGAMVGVLEAGGAMEVLVARILEKVKTRIGAQTLIATSGLSIFFDDYANTLLVGGTMRSAADRYRISRSKLAYLVDSTAAPVAGLAVVSTWAVTEMSYMVEGLESAGINDPAAGFTLFLSSIPYRFYPCLAIVMVFLIARSGRDFGPMARAEHESWQKQDDSEAKDVDDGSMRYPWLPTIVPVLVCVLVVIGYLIWSGFDAVGPNKEAIAWWRYFGVLIGNGNSYMALIWGGALGWICSLITHRLVCGSSAKTLSMGSLRGGWHMAPAILILWLAWALSAMTGDDALDTGGYLKSMLSDTLDPTWLPTIVFVLAGAMAFSTGTSWGTMAILTSLSVTLSLKMGDGDPNGALCLATTGSVLAGAIFGDHCSPISDTTVLSSRASGCDHVEHVRTQMPYAVVVGIVCVLFGCLPASFGLSPWISLAVGSVALWLVVRFVGKRLEELTGNADPDVSQDK
ncbi:MAG: Na+/H+ antiporter NhaC family protein [Planctomycetota bacterium]